MKRGKIIIIIIWILLLIGIFVYSKTKKEVNEEVRPDIVEKESLDKYEFIDYTDYYDENDLLVEEVKFDEENYNTYIKISGLKDKELEERLNKLFYDTANSFLSEGHEHVSSYVNFNAGNILSVTINSYHVDTPKKKYFNIDLVTGNEIKISDIVNTKNLIQPLSEAYYDAYSYSVGAEIRYPANSIELYNSCIEKNKPYCDEYLQEKTIEELNNQIAQFEKLIGEIEDKSLEFARNFDINQEFYITSAGIVLPNIKFDDVNNYETVMISTKNNPRLFNFYYKYKTDESIFDGSYTGKKNLMYAEYMKYRADAPTVEILDYATIHNDEVIANYDEKNYIVETDSFKKYLETLDKNKYYYLYNFSEYQKEMHITQCEMTKDLYENEVKKEIADSILKSNHTQGYYSIKNDNVTCTNISFFRDNYNVSIVYDEDYNKIINILNNEEKTNEINNYIKTRKNELLDNNKKVLININSVTESQITIEILYSDDYSYNQKEIKVFDL